MKLFDENGKAISLYDLCEYWIEKYPSDIFVINPKEVVEIRRQMKLILKKRDSQVLPKESKT